MSLIVAAAATFAEVPEASDLLREAGHEVRFIPLGAGASRERIAETLDGASAVLAGAEAYTSEVFAALPGLQHVARVGVGYDKVDVAAATAHDVLVTMTPGTNEWAVADHAFGLMLAMAHNIASNDHEVRVGRWRRPIGVDIWERTLGVVGLGRVGKGMILRAAGFRMRVLAYEPFPDQEFVRGHGVELVALDDLLAQSDFVSLHLPSTPETRHLIGSRQLSLMKRSAYLVNTSRGDLVDEPALIEALRAGDIAGAGLDVRHVEPPQVGALEELPNTVLTAHIAGFTDSAVRAMVLVAAQNVVDALNGREPRGVVNPEVWARQGARP